MSLHINEVRMTRVDRADEARGLLGWLTFRVGEHLRVDGVALRRSARGKLTLSFPERRDRQGRAHPYLKPTDDDARREIERQVFRALGAEGREE